MFGALCCKQRVIAVTKPLKDQEVVAKRLSAEICKAFPKDEAVSSLESFMPTCYVGPDLQPAYQLP